MILWRGRSQTAPSSSGGRQESGLSLAKYGRAGSRARGAAALFFVGRATERRVSIPFDVHSDACIGCDGETMTVRVFSQVPPDRIRALSVDPDSHTSVALARILWRDLYNREFELTPFEQK